MYIRIQSGLFFIDSMLLKKVNFYPEELFSFSKNDNDFVGHSKAKQKRIRMIFINLL